ncbi:unnamed protein product [Dicrocoelium dendriticum]|nr:unnamed protein product [Dicrocoelium dendriticum]
MRTCRNLERCEKQLRLADTSSEQDRMKCNWQCGAMELINLELHDTGIYNCKAQSGAVSQLLDYHLTVLPHEDNITVFLSEQHWQRDGLNVPGYPHKDVLNRTYLQDSVYINCRIVLPIGNDNYSSIHFEYILINMEAHLPYQRVDTWYSLQGRNNITYHIYRIEKHDTAGVVNKFKLQCSFQYEPTFRLTREHPKLPKEQKTVSNYVTAYTSLHVEPKIVASTIRTSHENVTDALNKTEAVFPNVAPFRLLRCTMSEECFQAVLLICSTQMRSGSLCGSSTGRISQYYLTDIV